MPPDEHHPPHDPPEWPSRARSNPAVARAAIPDLYHLCFEAQAAKQVVKTLHLPWAKDPVLPASVGIDHALG